MFSSTLNGTKVFLDFRAYSAEEGQDPVGIAKAIYEATVKWCTFVACALDYTTAMRARRALNNREEALRQYIDALKTKRDNFCFTDNIEEESATYGSLKHEEDIAENNL